ncbi:hypothetical protein [uncultured Clostridium sp.]|uniref:hypothetical protein n=1 Tax=uncultured Clostridium sp. TaxID=59620 RepID=UPI0026234458|nr:hypothetical protein [uncultured Clostridium sp.]
MENNLDGLFTLKNIKNFSVTISLALDDLEKSIKDKLKDDSYKDFHIIYEYIINFQIPNIRSKVTDNTNIFKIKEELFSLQAHINNIEVLIQRAKLNNFQYIKYISDEEKIINKFSKGIDQILKSDNVKENLEKLQHNIYSYRKGILLNLLKDID